MIKTMADALVEAHVSLIYTRAGLGIVIAAGEPTIPQHRQALVNAEARLAMVASRPELKKPPKDLAEQVAAKVDEILPGLEQAIAKYTLIRDKPDQAEVLYPGTEWFSDPQVVIDANTRLRDATIKARDEHLAAGLPIPGAK